MLRSVVHVSVTWWRLSLLYSELLCESLFEQESHDSVRIVPELLRVRVLVSKLRHEMLHGVDVIQSGKPTPVVLIVANTSLAKGKRTQFWLELIIS